MQRSRVDLPEPDAPIRQMTSCVATVEVDPAQDLEFAERLVEALDADRLASRRAATALPRFAPLPRDQPVDEPRQRDRDRR